MKINWWCVIPNKEKKALRRSQTYYGYPSYESYLKAKKNQIPEIHIENTEPADEEKAKVDLTEKAKEENQK